MYKLYQYIKHSIVHFKLERFCCIFPIRIGLLITGYFYIFAAVLSLIGVVDGGITPSIIAVQEEVDEEHVSSALCVLASAAEIMFNSVLLCGMYRSDIKLLRVYIYFVTASIVSSVLVYSIVFASISIPLKITIISNLLFQIYIILLVRSAIVEIKEEQSPDKNGDITLYSVVRTHDDDLIPPKSHERLDVEAAIELKPNEIKPKEAKPDELKLKEAKSDEIQLKEAKPDELKLKEAKSDEIKLKEAKPDELKLKEAKPDEIKLKDAKPDEFKLKNAKSDELKPKELKLVEAKITELKPDEPKPKEIKFKKLKISKIKPDEIKSNKPNLDEPKPEAKAEVQQPEQKKDDPPTKLETVNEQTTQKKRMKLF